MHTFIDRPLLNGQDADKWKKPADPEEVSSNLEKWYQAGRLLFPRESLQSIHDQITKPAKNGELITVKGFDDVVYEYRVQTGNRRWSWLPDYSRQDEEGWLEPENCERVQYTFSIERLHDQLEWGVSRAYSSLSIGHWMGREDKPDPPGDFAASLDLFRTSYAAWEDSAAWAEIRTTLRSLRLPCRITKVIGIANGTFAITPSDPEGYARSAVQHAFLLTVKKALQADGMADDEVACYVQDPAYTAADRAVLREYEMQVVEDPEGFLLMDAASVVFSCAPNICVKEIVADIVRPAVLVWCRVKEDDYASTDPNSPRVREMIEKEYEEFPFPEDGNFTTMRIYRIKGDT